MEKLDSFIKKIKKRPIREFLSPHPSEVITSFVDLKRTKPRIGFIRTNEAVDYKKYAAILEKNAELEKRLNELGAIDQPFESFDVKIILFARSGAEVPIEISWKDVFLAVASTTLAVSSESDIVRGIIEILVAHIDPNKPYNPAAGLRPCARRVAP